MNTPQDAPLHLHLQLRILVLVLVLLLLHHYRHSIVYKVGGIAQRITVIIELAVHGIGTGAGAVDPFLFNEIPIGGRGRGRIVQSPQRAMVQPEVVIIVRIQLHRYTVRY